MVHSSPPASKVFQVSADAAANVQNSALTQTANVPSVWCLNIEERLPSGTRHLKEALGVPLP